MSDNPLHTVGSHITGVAADLGHGSRTSSRKGVRLERPVKWLRPRGLTTSKQRVIEAVVPLIPDALTSDDFGRIATSPVNARLNIHTGRGAPTLPSNPIEQLEQMNWIGASSRATRASVAAGRGTSPRRAHYSARGEVMAQDILSSTDPNSAQQQQQQQQQQKQQKLVDPYVLRDTLALPLPLPVDILSALQRTCEAVQKFSPDHSPSSLPDSRFSALSAADDSTSSSLLSFLESTPKFRLRPSHHLLSKMITLANQHFRSARQSITTSGSPNEKRSIESITQVSGTSTHSQGESETHEQYYCSQDIVHELTAFFGRIDTLKSQLKDKRQLDFKSAKNEVLKDSMMSLIAPTTNEVREAGEFLKIEHANEREIENELEKLRLDIEWLRSTPLLIELDVANSSTDEATQTVKSHSTFEIPSIGFLARSSIFKRPTFKAEAELASEDGQELASSALRKEILSGLQTRQALRALYSKVESRRIAAVSRYAARFIFALAKKHNKRLERRVAISTALHRENRLTHFLQDISFGLTDEAVRQAYHIIVDNARAKYRDTSAAGLFQAEADPSQTSQPESGQGHENTKLFTPTTPGRSPAVSLHSPLPESLKEMSADSAGPALVAALGGEAFIRERATSAGLLLPNGLESSAENIEKFRQSQILQEQMQQQNHYSTRRSELPSPPPPLPLHAFPLRFYLDLAKDFPPFPLALALGHDMLHPSQVRNIKQRLGSALVAALVPTSIGMIKPTLGTNPNLFPIIPPHLSTGQLKALAEINPSDVVSSAIALARSSLKPIPPSKPKPQPIMGPQALQAAQQALHLFETSLTRRQAQMVDALPNSTLANPYFSPLFQYLSEQSRNLAASHFRLASLSCTVLSGTGPTLRMMRDAAGVRISDEGFAKYNFKWQSSIAELTSRFRKVLAMVDGSSPEERPDRSLNLNPWRYSTELLFEQRDKLDLLWMHVIGLLTKAQALRKRELVISSEETSKPLSETLEVIMGDIGQRLGDIRRRMRAYDALLQLLIQASSDLGLAKSNDKQNLGPPMTDEQIVWRIDGLITGKPANKGRRGGSILHRSPSSDLSLSSEFSTTSSQGNSKFIQDMAIETVASSPGNLGLSVDDGTSLDNSHNNDEEDDSDDNYKSCSNSDEDQEDQEEEDAEYSDDYDTANASNAEHSRDERKEIRARARDCLLTGTDFSDICELERLLLLLGDHASANVSSYQEDVSESQTAEETSPLTLWSNDNCAPPLGISIDKALHSPAAEKTSNEDLVHLYSSIKYQNLFSSLISKRTVLPDHLLPKVPSPRVFSTQLVWLATVWASVDRARYSKWIYEVIWPENSMVFLSGTLDDEGKPMSSSDHLEKKSAGSSSPRLRESLRLIVPNEDSEGSKKEPANPFSIQESTLAQNERLIREFLKRKQLAKRYLISIRSRVASEIHEAKVVLHGLSDANYAKWKAEGKSREDSRNAELRAIFDVLVAEGSKEIFDASHTPELEANSTVMTTAGDSQLEVWEDNLSISYTSAYKNARGMALLFAFSNLQSSLSKTELNDTSTPRKSAQIIYPSYRIQFKLWNGQTARRAIELWKRGGGGGDVGDGTLSKVASSPQTSTSASAELTQIEKAYFDFERLSLLLEEIDDCLDEFTSY